MPFTGGPSVRVSPNTSFDIRWVADFIGDGQVEIFDNPNGGTPIDTKLTSGPGNDHTITFGVGGVLKADTSYFFKVTHKDPTGTRPDLTSDPFPPVFTGAQALSNVKSSPSTDTADVSWDANVIGTGHIVWGTAALDQGPLTDTQNIPNHAFTLTGLTAGTTYQFKASNRHAIDGGALAEVSGQFQTQGVPAPGPTTTVELTQPHAEPRTIDPNEVSTLSIRAQNAGQAVAGTVVQFAVDASSKGSGSFGGAQTAQATTNASGIASVQFTGGNRGNVHVNVSSATARNSHQITVVVKRV